MQSSSEARWLESLSQTQRTHRLFQPCFATQSVLPPTYVETKRCENKNVLHGDLSASNVYMVVSTSFYEFGGNQVARSCLMKLVAWCQGPCLFI